MTNALRTPDDYELFIYTLTEQFPMVQRSTVRFVRLGTTLARSLVSCILERACAWSFVNASCITVCQP